MTSLPPPIPSAWDRRVVQALESRDGLPTEVRLQDGSMRVVHNVAVGYDSGDEHAHVTTNISPVIEGTTIDFFPTDAVIAVIDPASGAVVLSAG